MRAPDDPECGLADPQAAKILLAAFGPVRAEAALVVPGGAALRATAEGFVPLAPEHPLARAGAAAVAGRAPAVAAGAVAVPLLVGADPAGALACTAAGVDPDVLRGLATAAARALEERSLRLRLELDHARLLAGAREARADAEAAQRRLAFLDQASAALFGSPLDPRARLAKLAQLAVPDLADWCWVDVLEPSGCAAERLAIAHWNPDGAPIAAEERGRRLPLDGGTEALNEVLRSCSVRLVDDVEAHVRAGGADAALYRRLGARSALILPLRATSPLGTMTFLFAESNRRYGGADVVLATELAQRAALAVENAHLFEEASRAVRARDEMLAVVSHDLRNPLSAILANAGVLARRLPPGEEGERIRKRGEAIRRSAERMNHLIRDLLDMARIESRLLQVERAPHELGALIADALEMFQPVAADREVSLGVDMDDGGTVLLCDRERVLQVLSNLIGNAVKFTAAGGSVRLVARCDAHEVRFGVADTGPGIAPENLEQIFDRFWQVRASGRAGAGLGLSIARGIVQAHGGRIWAESRLGEGSTFWFTLPRAREESA